MRVCLCVCVMIVRFISPGLMALGDLVSLFYATLLFDYTTLYLSILFKGTFGSFQVLLLQNNTTMKSLAYVSLCTGMRISPKKEIKRRRIRFINYQHLQLYQNMPTWFLKWLNQHILPSAVSKRSRGFVLPLNFGNTRFLNFCQYSGIWMVFYPQRNTGSSKIFSTY